MRHGFGISIPFIEHIGFELLRFEGGESTVRYRPLAEHLNIFGKVHGGVMMTLMDTTMAQAARSVQPDHGAVTIEMKTSFFRPGEGSQVLRGEGRLLHRTRTLAFAEATIYDEAGQACAHATGTFKYSPLPAPGSQGAHPPPQEKPYAR
jgi:uncharacterized protein (TIGR00369 family)